MGWDSMPPASGRDFQQFKWIRQFYDALRERSFALGGRVWPKCNAVHATGTIASITTGTGTAVLTMASPDPVPSGRSDDGTCFNGVCRPLTCSGNFFAFLSCADAPYLASRYDVVIESDNALRNDPWVCVRGLITANTNSTITFETLQIDNHVTAGWLASLGSLVGKKFYVINKDGMWWGDRKPRLGRWLDYPNDPEAWRGGVYTGSMFNATVGYVEQQFDDFAQKDVGWAPGFWIGYECLVYDDGGRLWRIPITGNDQQHLYFGTVPNTGGTYKTFSGPFTIVVAGSKGDPQREGGAHRWWYGGIPELVYGHMPDDNIDNVADKAFAATSIMFPQDLAPGLRCLDQDHNAFDIDVWSELQNYCPPADFCYSPAIYKTLRGIQLAIENFTPQFVERKSYDDTEAIPNFTAARLFQSLGINSGTSTTSTGTAPYTFPIADVQYEGETIHFTVFAAGLFDSYGIRNGDNVVSGEATVVGGVVDVGSELWYAGLPVVWSAGWTRYHPLEVSHFYDSYTFIPDVRPSGIGGFATVDPPGPYDYCCLLLDPPPAECCNQCDGVGSWHSRLKSMKTKAFSALGYATEDVVFQEGDMVRYVGDGWADPGTGNQVFINAPGSSTANLLKKYWDHFYESRHQDNVQNILNGDTAGTVTASTVDSITDAGKQWWESWYGGGTLITHSGLSTDGSTTTLKTDSTWNDPNHEHHCWFALGRFPYATFPFEGFVIEIDKVAGGVTTTYKTPITNVTTDGTYQVIHFTATAGLTVVTGDAWRIKEPKYNLNRFKGRRVKIAGAGGVVTRYVTHSDNNTIWLDTPLSTPAVVGTNFSIIEYLPGGVWMYTETDPSTYSDDYQKIATGKWWVKPTGSDPRGQPWRSNQTQNLPHKSRKRFGRLRKGDYPYTNTFVEIYRAINSLVWTKRTAVQVFPDSDPNNYRAAVTNNDGTATVRWSDVKGDAETLWAVTGATYVNTAVGKLKTISGQPDCDPVDFPSQFRQARIQTVEGKYDCSATGVVGAVTTYMAHKKAAYVWCGVDASDNVPQTLDDGFGNLTKWLFNKQGDNVYWHRWGEVLVTGIITDESTRLTIADTDEEPSNWPPVPTGACGHSEVYQAYGWAIVEGPVVIVKWNVAGGMQFADTAD